MSQPTVSPELRPHLRRGVRLRHDAVRSSYVLLLPERVVMLNPSAAEILSLCDGDRTVAELIREMAHRYPGADLQADVTEFVNEAIGRRWLE